MSATMLFQNKALDRFYERLMDLTGPKIPDESYVMASDPEGKRYCRACLADLVGDDNIVSNDPVDGSAPSTFNLLTTDGCIHCAACGDLLDYVLTNEGIEHQLSEIEQSDALFDKHDIEHLLAVLLSLSESDPTHRGYVARMQSLAARHFASGIILSSTIH